MIVTHYPAQAVGKIRLICIEILVGKVYSTRSVQLCVSTERYNGVGLNSFLIILFPFPYPSTSLQTSLHFPISSTSSILLQLQASILPKEKPFWVPPQSPNPRLLWLFLRRRIRVGGRLSSSRARVYSYGAQGGASVPARTQTVRNHGGFETRHVRGWETCTHPEVRGGNNMLALISEVIPWWVWFCWMFLSFPLQGKLHCRLYSWSFFSESALDMLA